jgi:hypothetical protein
MFSYRNMSVRTFPVVSTSVAALDDSFVCNPESGKFNSRTLLRMARYVLMRNGIRFLTSWSRVEGYGLQMKLKEGMYKSDAYRPLN